MTSTGLLKKGLDIGSKAISSEIGKKIIDEGIKHAPDLYKFGTSKIKNKNLKRALNSDIADFAVKKARTELFTGNIVKVISNFQIGKALKVIDDPDINDNLVLVFPANQMNRFIDYKTMISEKKEQTAFHSSEH